MRSNKSHIAQFICAAVLSTFITLNCKANIVGPYTADVNTLHLWHMDQSTVPVLDSAISGGTNFTVLTNGATLGNTSFPGFGTAVSALGPALITNGACALAPRPLPSDTAITYAGPSGAFTYEAIVQIQYNPAANLGTVANGGTGRNTAMTIMAGEGNSNPERLFQFRIDPVGYNPNAGGFTTPLTQPALEFINVHQASSVQNIIMLIPTSGPDAIVQNGWYHVAVTYNGQPGAANNINFYWTLMDSNRLSASLLGSAIMNLNLSTGVTPNFVIGNTGRNPGGSTANPLNANFLGLIDEVRMSKIALGPGQMMFSAPAITIDVDVTNQVTVLGQTVNFAVSASGVPPLRYQWRHDLNNITGATQAVYTIPAVSLADVGNYDVVITNDYTAVTSSVGNLSLRTPVDLTWAGFGLPWDVSMSSSWYDSGFNNVVYTEGDNVTFDSQGAGSPLISISSPVYPSSVSVNADSDYTFTTSSGGGIYGKTGITKSGAGNLILDVDNSYAGPTVIQNGNVQVGAAAGRGSLGTGTVTNNGGLNFNRTDTFTVANRIAGAGGLTNLGSGTITLTGTNSFSGAIAVNSGGLTLASTQALGQATDIIVMAGGGGAGITGTRVTLGGGVFVDTNRTLSMLQSFASPDIRCNLYTSSGTNAWNGPIVLGGDGTIAFAADAANAELDVNGSVTGAYTGKLTLRGVNGRGFVNGVLNLPNAQVNKTDSSVWTISSTGNSWVSTDIAAGTLRMGANNVFPATAFVNLVGGNLDLGGYNQQIGGVNCTNAGFVVGNSSTNSDSLLSVNAAIPSTNWGVIQDSVSGGTRKMSLSLLGGTLTLTNVNTYSGDTTISGGTLYLVGPGSIANSRNIDIESGATLDVSGRSDGSFAIGANQVLKGSDVFNVTGNLTNAGTIELKASKSGSTLTSDRLQVSSQIAYGGTLKLDLSGDPLANGDAFTLFSASSYTGQFPIYIPSVPGPGLAWYSGTLAVDGKIRVLSVPISTNSIVAGTNFTVNGYHGPPNQTFVVISTLNMTSPRDFWTPLATNSFDADGNFSFTLPIQRNVQRRFFTIWIP